MKKGKRKVSHLNKIRIMDSKGVLVLMVELCIPEGSFSPLIQKWMRPFCGLLKTRPSSLFIMLGWSWISITSLMIQTMLSGFGGEVLNVLEMDSYTLSLYKATMSSMQFTLLGLLWIQWQQAPTKCK